MRITMQTIAAGPDFFAQPGDTIDVPAATAAAMVAGGYAVAADPDPDPEPEVAAAPVAGERAEMKSKSKRS
jgi:hypothetical protein